MLLRRSIRLPNCRSACLEGLPCLLPPERLAAGNALLQGTTQCAGLVGPALGGVLVTAAGVAAAFGIDAASFFFSFVLVSLIG